MRKNLPVLSVVVVLLLMHMFLVVPALAITQATPDTENTYSNTGVIGYKFSGEESIRYLCSGILIDPTHFLTAAHCMAWMVGLDVEIYVSFDNPIFPELAGNTVIPAIDFTVHPWFGHDQANLYDLAVLTLPLGSTAGISPAALATEGLLDSLNARDELRKVNFISVGYGIQADWEPTQFYWDGWRNYSSAPLMALVPALIYLNINEHATGGGGACYGDSGGPIFLPQGEELILVGVTTLRSDHNCRAMTSYYRIDTAWSRDFLSQFVVLP